MNQKQAQPFSATNLTSHRLIRLLLVLLVLSCCVGISKAQDQTEPTQDQTYPRKTNLTRGFKIVRGDIQMPEAYSP